MLQSEVVEEEICLKKLLNFNNLKIVKTNKPLQYCDKSEKHKAIFVKRISIRLRFDTGLTSKVNKIIYQYKCKKTKF